jgi:hypothetical protein
LTFETVSETSRNWVWAVDSPDVAVFMIAFSDIRSPPSGRRPASPAPFRALFARRPARFGDASL